MQTYSKTDLNTSVTLTSNYPT